MPNLPRDQHLDPEGLALFLNTLETNVMSAEYSSSATYAVGAYCVYNNKIYRCTTAITSGETWDATHWTSVLLTDEIKSKGTVNSVRIGNTEYTPTSGVVTLPNASIMIDGTTVAGKNDSAHLNFISGDNVEITPESATTSRISVSVNAKSRSIQLNGTEILGNNTTPLNLVEGSGVSLSNSGGSVTISSYGTAVVSQETTSDNSVYRVLFSGTADDVDVASITRKNSALTFNPYTGSLSATSMYNQMFTTTNANGDIRVSSWVGGNDDGVLDVYDPNNVCTVSLSGATGKLTARYAEFNATDSSISFTGSNATYPMIRFIDNTSDVNGNGIAIGGGGQSIIGGGESASTMLAQAGTSGSEIMYIGNDSDVYIFTNLQSGWASRKEFKFDTNGNMVIGGQVERAGGNTSWINGRDVAPVKTTSGGGAWNPVVSAKSVNGAWGIGTLNDALYFSYGTDANYNAGTNTTNNYSIDANGNFSGNAATATTATKLGTATVGGADQLVYLNNGTPTAGTSASTSATANTIAKRQGNGYLYATYYNTSMGSANISSYTSEVAFVSSDGFLRKTTLANFKTWFGKANSASTADSATTATNLKGSKAGIKFYAGTSIANPNGGNACRLVYASTLNTYFGVSNCGAGNTALFVSNGDGATWDGHYNGCTWLASDKAWWATFSSSHSGNIRLNWLAVYFG